MIVFHISQVLINVPSDRLRKIHVRLFDMCNRSHLLDCFFDLITEHFLFHDYFIVAEWIEAFFRPEERLEWLEVLAFDLEIDLLELDFKPIRVTLVVYIGVHILHLRVILVDIHLPPFEVQQVLLVVPSVRVNRVAHIRQPERVIVQLVTNFQGICVLQIGPDVLVVEHQVDLSIFARLFFAFFGTLDGESFWQNVLVVTQIFLPFHLLALQGKEVKLFRLLPGCQSFFFDIFNSVVDIDSDFKILLDFYTLRISFSYLLNAISFEDLIQIVVADNHLVLVNEIFISFKFFIRIIVAFFVHAFVISHIGAIAKIVHVFPIVGLYALYVSFVLLLPLLDATSVLVVCLLLSLRLSL